MKALVVGWPIILITFGQEARPELAEGLLPPFFPKPPRTRGLSTLFNFNHAQCCWFISFLFFGSGAMT